MRRKGSFACALLLCLSATAAEATTYYVATTGNNANPGTQALPWRTIQMAANTVNPGDVVNIRGGTYSEAVTFSRGGTVGNPVTFQAFSGETPILDGTGVGAVLGAINVNDVPNVIIDGLTVQNYIGTSQGAVALIRLSGIGVGGSPTPIPNNSTTIIRNNTLHHFSGGIDNPSGVAVTGYAGTVEIGNNTIHDISGSANILNDTCVVVFNDQLGNATTNVQIHNNLCYNVGIGIKWKHPADATTTMTLVIEKNIVHDTSQRSAIEVNGTRGAIIRNNIIYNVTNLNANPVAIRIGVDNPGAGSGTQVYNNSTFNVAAGVMNSAGELGSGIHDNIFHSTSPAVWGIAGFWLDQLTGYTLIDRNLYAGTFNQGRADMVSETSFENLAQFQARGYEAHGLAASNPLYVNPTTDFHLQAASPAKGIGTGSLDMGAYPNGNEVIGPTSITPPLAPGPLVVTP